MSDIIERLRDRAAMLDEAERPLSDAAIAADEITRLQTENNRLLELLRSEGANRYWEGRWRDEAAANARFEAKQTQLASALARIAAGEVAEARQIALDGLKGVFRDETVAALGEIPVAQTAAQ